MVVMLARVSTPFASFCHGTGCLFCTVITLLLMRDKCVRYTSRDVSVCACFCVCLCVIYNLLSAG